MERGRSGFPKTTPILKIAAAVLFFTLVIDAVGFGTPYWNFVDRTEGEFRSGLWQTCVPVSGCSDNTGDGVPDWMKATQAMETIGLVILLLSTMMVISELCCFCGSMMKMIIIIETFFAGIFIFIGIIIWGAETDSANDILHFSFAFCTASVGMCWFAGILLIVDYKITRKYRRQKREKESVVYYDRYPAPPYDYPGPPPPMIEQPWQEPRPYYKERRDDRRDYRASRATGPVYVVKPSYGYEDFRDPEYVSARKYRRY